MESNEVSGKSIALWAGLALLLTAVLVGAFVLVGSGKTPGDTGVSANLPPVTSSDWILGSPTAPATLIEYSDFQCPACEYYYPIVEQVLAEEGANVRFVYRNFPLSQHPQGEPAARAAEAAGRQGKFWEMYRLLFGNSSEWTGNSEAAKVFEGYATRLSLDLQKYRSDFNSSEIKRRVQEQEQGGISAGVNATPTFFLNGRKLTNPGNIEEFKQLINAAITNSNSSATTTSDQ